MNTTTRETEKLITTLGEEWFNLLNIEFTKPYMINLSKWITERKKLCTVYPASKDIFTTFRLTQPSDIKVIALSQDPYHNGVAHGLAFSSNNPNICPPSLEVIFKELENDLGHPLVNIETDLTRWAKQGVFLLNTLLTVDKGQPLSHTNQGWEQFTSKVVQEVYKLDKPIVWWLWGKKAQEEFAMATGNLLVNPKHLILTAAHPAAESYLSGTKKSAGYYGSKPFSKTNKFLTQNYGKGIEW